MLVRRIIAAVVLAQYTLVMLAGGVLHRHDVVRQANGSHSLHGSHGAHAHFGHAHHGSADADASHTHFAAHGGASHSHAGGVTEACCGEEQAAALAVQAIGLSDGECLLCILLAQDKTGHLALTSAVVGTGYASAAAVQRPPTLALEPILSFSARGPPSCG